MAVTDEILYLRARLQRVERQIWMFTVIFLLATVSMLVLAVGVGRGLSQTEFVGAKTFVLFDSSRRPRAILNVTGNQREDAPLLVLMDQKGNKRVTLEAGLLGRTVLSIYDALTKNRVLLWVDDEGRTRFIFSDVEGVNKMEFAMSPNGLPQITMRDANGRPSIHLGVTERGPLVRLLNKEGEVVFQAP